MAKQPKAPKQPEPTQAKPFRQTGKLKVIKPRKLTFITKA